nr:MAG TPA: hypothetical protein [Caudoviricetes sp.]
MLECDDLSRKNFPYRSVLRLFALAMRPILLAVTPRFSATSLAE